MGFEEGQVKKKDILHEKFIWGHADVVMDLMVIGYPGHDYWNKVDYGHTLLSLEVFYCRK